MEELPTTLCPDCESKNFVELDSKPYGEQTYKRGKEFGREWDKKTKYCKSCGDVVMYCKCYEALEDFLDINGKL